MADAAILVLTSLPDHESAQALARLLVTEHLAACVNIGPPVESMYHWRGEFETAREVPVVIKTRQASVRRRRGGHHATHPYELPEVIAVPILHGLPGYLDWIEAETAQA